MATYEMQRNLDFEQKCVNEHEEEGWPPILEEENFYEKESAKSHKESEESLCREELERVLRALAEKDNIVKRLERQAEEQKLYGISFFAKEMLCVLDNIERALESGKISGEEENAEGAIDSLRQGMVMVLDEGKRVLDRFGIKKIDAMGAELDPHVHEVMAMDEEGEGTADHTSGNVEGDASSARLTVCRVLQDGYMIHKKVLRPAAVAVRSSIS